MSISLRTHRAQVFSYADAGSAGVIDSVYVPVLSSDADGKWWVAIGVPTGREYTIGMSPEHAVDAVLGFSAEVPMGVNYAVIIDGNTYQVNAVLPRDYGRSDIQVLVSRVVGLDLTTT